jgi:hypothetical protein
MPGQLENLVAEISEKSKARLERLPGLLLWGLAMKVQAAADLLERPSVATGCATFRTRKGC